MCDQGLVEEYFSSINCMASRMLVDTASIRQQLGAAWDTLTYEDQCRILTDGIVKPKVRDKYSYYPHEKPDVESFPKLLFRSGEKYVIDEDAHGKGSGYTWRDEHSGPFTWQTQSQLDLTLTDTRNRQPCPLPPKNVANRVDLPKSGYIPTTNGPQLHGPNPEKAPELTPRKNRPREPPISQMWKAAVAHNSDLENNSEICVASAVSKIEDLTRAKLAERENHRKPQPNVKSTSAKPEQKSENFPEADPDIPRTGFDFLDNW